MSEVNKRYKVKTNVTIIDGQKEEAIESSGFVNKDGRVVILFSEPLMLSGVKPK